MRPTPAFVVALALAACHVVGPARGADVPLPLPKVADSWAIERVAEAPQVLFPTAIVAAPDGTIYVGQDPMDMPGPATSPTDSVVALRGGKAQVFADGLWAVMGLEWVDGSLFVVHAPFLSAFTDTDGDGRADRRVDLVTGLGPKVPGFNGLNDHVASGLRLGIDGFLYVAVGDKGIPRGVGTDGATITLKGGGVIRVRPDGTGLEVVSTGERNPLSVALSDRDDVFTYGNDDDSKKWPNSLTHHIVGGHHGYPYEFLTAPWRALPIVAGELGGSGAQVVAYHEDGLPARYRGSLLVCDWGLQVVDRYVLAREGATFRVERKEPFVQKGGLGDFRPFSIAVDSDRSSLLLVDWAYNGWLADGPKTGRIFRLTYVGKDRVAPRPRHPGSDVAAPLADLDHPALSVRRDAQRRLASRGEAALPHLTRRLVEPRNATGRIHALWALDAIGSPASRRAIREAIADKDPDVRLQAARSAGIRRDATARDAILPLLRAPQAPARREAAIAVGRLGDLSAGPTLYAALGDPDPFVAWSIRRAIRGLDAWIVPELVAALRDPRRSDDALMLADESWSLGAIEALALAFSEAREASFRSRILANIAAQYRKYPDWNGRWFGTNPLAGEFPAKTVAWDRRAMERARAAIASGLADADPGVRRQAILGLSGVGPETAPQILAAIPGESDARNRAAMVATLGRWGVPGAVPLLAALVRAEDQPIAVRAEAIDALASIRTRPASVARFQVVYDPKAPPELVARALPTLGRTGALPANDLAAFLVDRPAPVRVAALLALREARALPEEVRSQVVGRLDDEDAGVRAAAIEAVARLKLREAIPRLAVLARSEPTRAEAARALETMPDPRALDVYLSDLSGRSPEARKAAGSALIAIRAEVAAPLTAMARAGQFSGPAATAVERALANFRPVVAWKVIGPFPRTVAQVFVGEASIDFSRTHAGVEGRPIRWADRAADPATGRVSIDDFKGGSGDRGGFGYDVTGSPDLAAFAYAMVESDRDRPAMLLVGSSGSLIVTLNEAAVLTHPPSGGRAYAPDSDIVRVDLRRGRNRILVRSRQGIGLWSFGLQVSDPSDLNLASLATPTPTARLRSVALKRPGDPRKGEALFFDARGLNCVCCHATNGRGSTAVGPDLTGLASKYDRDEIVRSILEPSSRIATGYQPVVLALRGGTVVTGVVRTETDHTIELVDSEGRAISIARSQVEERRAGDVSIMPTGLVDALAPEDFADLVAYLASLKAAPRP